jgi:protein-disulfide isomerase
MKTGAMVVLAGVVIGGFFVGQQVGNKPALPTPTPQPSPTALLTGVPLTPGVVQAEDTDLVLGRAEAPKTLFLFTQWHCAECRHFFTATLPKLKSAMDTGKLRLVLKVFPLAQDEEATAEAERLAYAAYCAAAQGKLWEYTQSYEAAAGLNQDTFMACIERREYAQEVARNIRSAVDAGVTTIPAFVLDDHLYEGMLSFAELESLLQ